MNIPFPNSAVLVGLLCAAAVVLILLRARQPKQNWIVVDGSNVLYWERETPIIQTILHVIDALQDEGYIPVVWFDANAGYLISDRYMGPAPLAKLLKLPARQVYVAPKGTPADPLLLKGAVHLKARVVTNDRFRDWIDQFPQIQEKGFLVRGRMHRDSFELELGE